MGRIQKTSRKHNQQMKTLMERNSYAINLINQFAGKVRYYLVAFKELTKWRWLELGGSSPVSQVTHVESVGIILPQLS